MASVPNSGWGKGLVGPKCASFWGTCSCSPAAFLLPWYFRSLLGALPGEEAATWKWGQHCREAAGHMRGRLGQLPLGHLQPICSLVQRGSRVSHLVSNSRGWEPVEWQDSWGQVGCRSCCRCASVLMCFLAAHASCYPQSRIAAGLQALRKGV